MWLSAPEGFPHHSGGWEWKWLLPNLQHQSWKLTPPNSSLHSRGKSISYSCLSGPPSVLKHLSICDQAFLSLPCNSVSSFQTLTTPATCTRVIPPRVGIGVLPWLCHLLGPSSESGHFIMPWFMVYGNTKLAHWLQLASPFQLLRALPYSGTLGLHETRD